MRTIIFIFIMTIINFNPAHSSEIVIKLSNGFALLNMPKKTPNYGIIFFKGNTGYVGIQTDGRILNKRSGSMMISTRNIYSKKGIASLLVDQGASVDDAVQALLARGVRKIYVSGESRGCLRSLEGTRKNISGYILISCMHDRIIEYLGTSDRIPKNTLIIHHKQDRCYGTLPYKAIEFIRWAGNRVKVLWITGGYDDGGHPCRAKTYHGMSGNEMKVVNSIINHLKR